MSVKKVEANSTWILNVNRKFLESDHHRYFTIFNLLFSAEFLVQDMERSGTNPMVFSRRFPFSSWLSYILLISSEYFIKCMAFDNYHFLDILSRKQYLIRATVIW